MTPSKFTLTTLFTTAFALSGCGDGPELYVESGDDFGFTAPDAHGEETGDAGFESGDESADSGLGLADDESGYESGYESGCEDTGSHDPGSTLDPDGDGAGTDGDPPIEAGFCMDGGNLIGACSNEDPLVLDCSPAFLASCDAAGYTFEPSTPDQVPTDWDCDDNNEFLINCSGGFLTACSRFGGYIDCHWYINGVCVEATCMTEPIPG